MSFISDSISSRNTKTIPVLYTTQDVTKETINILTVLIPLSKITLKNRG